MQATITVGFYCGTTQRVVNHTVEETPAYWAPGTVVTVLDCEDHLHCIELPNGLTCKVDAFRLKF